MNKPPKMFSTKDILYFSDVLNVTRTYVKKFKHYENMIKDATIKKQVSTAAKDLEKQYNSLMGVLKNG